MNQKEWSDPAGGAQASPGEPSGQEYLREEKRAAERLVDDAKAAASSAGAQAKEAAADKAEELQGMAASHLRKFADAVRMAGDDLAEKDPGPVSDIVRQAAQGLEQFSGSLGRQSPAEMIDGFRNFGRQNAVGFLAGAMLAGFSLARFAGSGAPSGPGKTASRESTRTVHGASPDPGRSQRHDEPDAMTGGGQSPEFGAGSEDFGKPMTPGMSGDAPYDRPTSGASS